jgi:hypothetical protein
VVQDALEATIRELYAQRDDPTIFLEADRSLPYAKVVDLMDACRAAGVPNRCADAQERRRDRPRASGIASRNENRTDRWAIVPAFRRRESRERRVDAREPSALVSQLPANIPAPGR